MRPRRRFGFDVRGEPIKEEVRMLDVLRSLRDHQRLSWRQIAREMGGFGAAPRGKTWTATTCRFLYVADKDRPTGKDWDGLGASLNYVRTMIDWMAAERKRQAKRRKPEAVKRRERRHAQRRREKAIAKKESADRWWVLGIFSWVERDAYSGGCRYFETAGPRWSGTKVVEDEETGVLQHVGVHGKWLAPLETCPWCKRVSFVRWEQVDGTRENGFCLGKNAGVYSQIARKPVDPIGYEKHR